MFVWSDDIGAVRWDNATDTFPEQSMRGDEHVKRNMLIGGSAWDEGVRVDLWKMGSFCY